MQRTTFLVIAVLICSAAAAQPDPANRLGGAVFSYFTGPEQRWKTALPAFSTIVYRELWPGIDLVYKGTVNELKYAFVVAPGADPAQIRLRYRGVSRLAVTADGALTVSTPAGGFRDAPPAAYQEIGGRQVPVAMVYDLKRDPRDPASFGFRIGRFDDSRPLILDPVILVYCGFIGGSEEDQAEAIAVDDLVRHRPAAARHAIHRAQPRRAPQPVRQRRDTRRLLGVSRHDRRRRLRHGEHPPARTPGADRHRYPLGLHHPRPESPGRNQVDLEHLVVQNWVVQNCPVNEVVARSSTEPESTHSAGQRAGRC